ncbi:MAG TPA: pitrilysin family protein [Bacteroidota bacterium]|nr:pitrilysin family protein [Bacteroidota bacterium]
MKLLSAGHCLLVTLVVTAAPAMSDAIFPYKATTAVLPNGLKVIMIPMDAPGLVSYYSVVRTGSRDEVEPGRSGYAHFFEHMMFRGTKKYPGPVYDSIVTSIGASANAYTSDDVTAYHLNFAAEDLPKVIEVESDRFQNLSYDLPAFQTESGAIYGEYRKGVTNPFEVLDEKMRDIAFDVHTYKHTTIGFERDIKAMPEGFEYSQGFFRKFYRPENVVLLIVGDIKPDAVLKLVKKYYGPWEKGYQPPDVKQEPPQAAARSGEVSYPGKTLPILDMGYKGDAFDPANRDFVAAEIFGELAFGSTSDLYKRLYIKEQRVDALQASIPPNRDMPLFEIFARIKKEDDIGPIRAEIEKTIAQFQSTPVDPGRLDAVKKRSRYEFLMSLDTPDRVAGRLARIVAITGGIEAIDAYYTTLAKITPDDVMHAANKYFVPARCTTVILKGVAQ